MTLLNPLADSFSAGNRGDRYVSEVDIPVSALKPAPGLTEPQPRAIVERRPGQ